VEESPRYIFPVRNTDKDRALPAVPEKRALPRALHTHGEALVAFRSVGAVLAIAQLPEQRTRDAAKEHDAYGVAATAHTVGIEEHAGPVRGTTTRTVTV
tara:strand:- start:29465 stop:29761 length:297 start_codon:yes stop_codon:yes gene_type:complete